jgi:amino acid transporter
MKWRTQRVRKAEQIREEFKTAQEGNRLAMGLTKVTASFLVSSIIVGGVLGAVGLFVSGFVTGLLGYTGGVSNLVAYGICFAIMLPVVLVLVLLRRRVPEAGGPPSGGTGR